MSPEGKYKLVPYALLALVVILLYGNTLYGGFVWDDNLFAANEVYWGFDWRRIFFSLANGLEYQPVRDLTYLFDIAVWKNDPFGFHLTNLLLFIAIVFLVYKTTESLSLFARAQDNRTPRWFVPIFTTLFFTVHPLKSEVVAWVTQRNTLLAAFFLFLSLVCFLRYQEEVDKKAFFFSLSAFSLAIFSKAIVVTLPLLLLFFMLLKERAERRQDVLWASLTPFFIVSAAGAALHIAIARKTAVISTAYSGHFSERLSVALQIPFFYLEKSLLPTDISAFYAENFTMSLSSPKVLLAAFSLAVLTVTGWLLRNKTPEILMGGGWFIITLLPVSNLFATSPVAADRYLFLPSFGLAFTAAALLGRIRLPIKALIFGALPILGFFALLTVEQNRIWHDDISLWRETARHSPEVAGIWFNLGRALQGTPQLALALDAYLRAHKLDPADMKSLDNAASLFPSSRGPLAARHQYVKALAEQLPPYPAGLGLIGYTVSEWQHPDVAEELFLYLLNGDSQSLPLQLALANLYRKLGAFDRAVPIYNAIVVGGRGLGEAEFGLANVAAAKGNEREKVRLLQLAKAKGGVPEALLGSN